MIEDMDKIVQLSRKKPMQPPPRPAPLPVMRVAVSADQVDKTSTQIIVHMAQQAIHLAEAYQASGDLEVAEFLIKGACNLRDGAQKLADRISKP